MLFRTQNIFVGSATPASCRSVSRPGRPEEEEAREIKQACKRCHRQSAEKSKKEKKRNVDEGWGGLSGECLHNVSCKNQFVAASYPSGGQESQTHPFRLNNREKNKHNRKEKKRRTHANILRKLQLHWERGENINNIQPLRSTRSAHLMHRLEF